MSNKTFTLLSKKINKDKIIDILGSVYEHSSWVPERLISFDIKIIKNSDELFIKMKSIVECASDKEKLKLLCAHPELGNKLQKLNNLTDFSKLEQKSAGLDQCSDEEFETLTRLNKEYRAKFNFPFIIAVKGLTKANIIDEMKKRVKNSYNQEFNTALKEVHKIAKIRIDDIKF
jgi:2-oxo-4-hydroxy-4-carboxy-5-ureidoimidazoline decarboxylase|tara:strand:- start:287 stop:808 length:522 start_codon:yes stop_codon:yes gene_type:complete